MRTAFILLIIMPLTAMAETAYITDNLRLGLHNAVDTSDRAFRTLESGQALEILSRNRNYAHVRLPDGVEGYVKAAYLVTEKPAKLIVAESQSTSEALQKEIDELNASFAAPAATIERLQTELTESQATASQYMTEAGEFSAEVDDLRSRQEQYKYSLPLLWVGGAMLVCLLAGFLAGLWWVDAQSRRRHGGVRIY